MSPNPLQSLPPLHLYRQLLREASYLPPALEPFVSTQVRTRFRRCRRHDAERSKSDVRVARHALRKVKAANCGRNKDMEALVMQAFGRKGKQERRLMSDFLKPEPVSSTSLLAKTLEELDDAAASGGASEPPTKKRRKQDFFLGWDQDKLTRLLKSQATQQKHTSNAVAWPRAAKGLNPDASIPKVSIWGKPITENLANTKRSKWWIRAIGRAIPPVPKGEWDLLAKLSNNAQGDEVQWMVPQRRVPVPVSGHDTSSGDWDWAAHASLPTSKAENNAHPYRDNWTGAGQGGPYSPRRRTNLTTRNRWFRRAYQRTWMMTPFIEKDPKTLISVPRWPSTHQDMAAPRPDQMDAFEGISHRAWAGKSLRRKLR